MTYQFIAKHAFKFVKHLKINHFLYAILGSTTLLVTSLSYAAAEPVEFDARTVNEAICKYGYPVLVGGWDLDPHTRFVNFRGPFHFSDKNYVKEYAYIATENLDEGRGTTSMLHDDLEWQAKVNHPEDLEKLKKIPLITAVSNKEEDLLKQFRGWDYSHKRLAGKRVVYAKTVCFKQKVYDGIYFDLNKDGEVEKLNLITDREKLVRISYDLRTYTNTDMKLNVGNPFHYSSHPVQKNGPVDVLLRFIVSKEFGMVNQAGDQLYYDKRRASDFGETINQSVSKVEMDVGSFIYTILEQQPELVKISVSYNLVNGKKIAHTYGIKFEDKQWMIYE